MQVYSYRIHYAYATCNIAAKMTCICSPPSTPVSFNFQRDARVCYCVPRTYVSNITAPSSNIKVCDVDTEECRKAEWKQLSLHCWYNVHQRITMLYSLSDANWSFPHIIYCEGWHLPLQFKYPKEAGCKR